mgnify:CR=1 FL=1
MTVSSTDRTAGPFIRNGSQLEYPFEMRVFADTDLVVAKTDLDGVVSTLVLGSDYTVEINEDQTIDPGGTLVMLDVGTAGEILNATTELQATQGARLPNGSAWLPRIIENALDKLTILIQQLGITKTQLLRAPFPETLAELPAKAARAGRVAAYDANGDPTTIVGVDSGSAAALNADLVSSASGKGDAIVAVKSPRTGSVATTQHEVNARTVSLNDFLSAAQIADAQAGTGSIGISTALQAAIDSMGGEGIIKVESGTYLLDSVASSDSSSARPNGVVFRWDNTRKYVRPYIRLIGKAGVIFKAGANNQIMIRVSRQNVEVSGIHVDRNGYTGVTFCGVVPEDRSQTTQQVNQSYFLSSECGNTYKGDLVIRGVECMYEFQPGPQVGGADSGCFFPTIIRPQTIDGGTLFRTVKNVDHASHPNFITRALILHPQCNNNTGPVLDLDNIGDMTVVEPNFELHATGIKLTAITSYAKIVRCIGGYFEAGTVDIDTASTSGILMLGTKYDTAKVTGTGAANVAYQQADGWQIVYDAAGATARATVDSAGSLRLMSDPTNARSTSITRIGADGADLLSLTPFLKASNTAADESGSFHEIASNQSVAPMLRIKNSHASAPTGMLVNFSAAAPNNTTQYAYAFSDNSSTKFIVYSNGAVQNPTGTIGTISDEVLKENITDAPSTWDKFKAYRWVHYYLKDMPEAGKLLGLVAQEARQVSPGVVYEAPEFLPNENGALVESGRTLLGVKSSIVTMQAHVALQEAMRRIEVLEAKLQERGA